MTTPTTATFKAYFVRDFPYGSSITTSVVDADITRAISEASAVINTDLFSSNEELDIAYMFLTAHFLVSNIKASSQGINGSFTFLENSKSVGSVSQSFQIPDFIANSPLLSPYAKTHYGMRYLQLCLPYLVGNVFSVEGATLP